MKIVNVIQGTPEWHAHRANYFNASDAPAMMGESSYKTRTQLLHERKTGITPEVDAATQRRFDDGHRFEALARERIAEGIVGDELYPCVGVEGKLSASFDGLTMDGSIAFEHKTLNATIKECANASELPAEYRIQMEQQLMVSGASKCLFVASKWDDEDNLIDSVKFWYESTPALAQHIAMIGGHVLLGRSTPTLAQQITDGWAQFEKDLAEYAHEPVATAKVGATMETLPALNVQVNGMVTASNIELFKSHALEAIGSVNKDLETDQDFADAEKAIKWCVDVEGKLKSTKDHALSQTASIDALFKAIDDISETARQTRLQLEKLVKSRKELIRTEMVVSCQNLLNSHIESLNTDLSVALLPTITADFAGVIKGKKTIESIDNALKTELANAKIKADWAAREITANLKILNEFGAEHKFLFSDLQSIITKPADDFANIVKMRVSEHKQAEQKRIESERERIRAEEQSKAQREAQPKPNNRAEEDAKPVMPTAANTTTEPACKTSKSDRTITIPLEEYENLLKAHEFLECLICEGVDNWDGYVRARESMLQAD